METGGFSSKLQQTNQDSFINEGLSPQKPAPRQAWTGHPLRDEEGGEASDRHSISFDANVSAGQNARGSPVAPKATATSAFTFCQGAGQQETNESTSDCGAWSEARSEGVKQATEERLDNDYPPHGIDRRYRENSSVFW